jgi:hypothetical protein
VVKTIFFGIIALVPGLSFSSSNTTSDSASKAELNYKVWKLAPGDQLKVYIRGNPVLLDYWALSSKLGYQPTDKFSDIIGVRIHEESAAVDLSNLDGIAITIPLAHLNEAPPNYVTGE